MVLSVVRFAARCEDIRPGGPFCCLPAVVGRRLSIDAACSFLRQLEIIQLKQYFAAFIQHECSSPYSQRSVMLVHLARLFSVQAPIEMYPLIKSLEWAGIAQSV
jgi:hypothetical protein